MTAKEVTAALQVSTATLYRLMERGQFPRPIKFGSLSRWPQSEILAALQAAAERRAAS